MHGPVPQASPPQPQVSHSITSAGTPSVARSAASLWQLHLEYGVEPTHSCWIHALPGTQGVRVSSKRCVPAARAGCGAATNSRHAFLGHFRRFWPIYSCNNPLGGAFPSRFSPLSRGSRGGYPLAALGSEDWCDAIHAGVFSGGRLSVHGVAPSPTAPASSRVSRE